MIDRESFDAIARAVATTRTEAAEVRSKAVEARLEARELVQVARLVKKGLHS